MLPAVGARDGCTTDAITKPLASMLLSMSVLAASRVGMYQVKLRLLTSSNRLAWALLLLAQCDECASMMALQR